MPGAVPHTSTYALTNVTLPYAVELANHGWRATLAADPALALGLNTHDGRITYGPVAEAHAMEPVDLAESLGVAVVDRHAEPGTLREHALPFDVGRLSRRGRVPSKPYGPGSMIICDSLGRRAARGGPKPSQMIITRGRSAAPGAEPQPG